MMTSLVGYRIPWRRAGIVFLSRGKAEESQEKKTQKNATKANCMRVRVAGFGNAFRIDFEDVFVRALERYHTIHKTYVD